MGREIGHPELCAVAGGTGFLAGVAPCFGGLRVVAVWGERPVETSADGDGIGAAVTAATRF